MKLQVAKADQVLDELKEEREDAQTCVVCLDKQRSQVLVPCGHAQYCKDCVKDLQTCPQCRTVVEAKHTFYMWFDVFFNVYWWQGILSIMGEIYVFLDFLVFEMVGVNVLCGRSVLNMEIFYRVVKNLVDFSLVANRQSTYQKCEKLYKKNVKKMKSKLHLLRHTRKKWHYDLWILIFVQNSKFHNQTGNLPRQ